MPEAVRPGLGIGGACLSRRGLCEDNVVDGICEHIRAARALWASTSIATSIVDLCEYLREAAAEPCAASHAAYCEVLMILEEAVEASWDEDWL